VSGTATRVPYITGGNPLKTRKNAKHGLTHEPKAHTRHDHDPGAPHSPPGRHSGTPLESGLPRSRAQRPLRRGPPRSRAQRPLDEVRPARGHLHALRPRSCPRVWAFNALTPQDARHDRDTPGNRVPALFHRLPGGGHPRHCVTLCDETRVSPVTLCRQPRTVNTSSPRRGAGGTLEYLFRDYAGPRRDVRPAGAVFPVAVNPVRPSPPLPHHTGHCDDIPMLLECTGTRRRHDSHCAAYGPPFDDTLESARGGGRTTNHYAATLEAAPVRAQDAPRRLD
jgi:hypothetical protein